MSHPRPRRAERKKSRDTVPGRGVRATSRSEQRQGDDDDDDEAGHGPRSRGNSTRTRPAGRVAPRDVVATASAGVANSGIDEAIDRYRLTSMTMAATSTPAPPGSRVCNGIDEPFAHAGPGEDGLSQDRTGKQHDLQADHR